MSCRSSRRQRVRGCLVSVEAVLHWRLPVGSRISTRVRQFKLRFRFMIGFTLLEAWRHPFSSPVSFQAALPCKAHSTQSMSHSLKNKPPSTAPSGRARVRTCLTSSCPICCLLRASWLRPFRAPTDLTSWWEMTPESAEAYLDVTPANCLLSGHKLAETIARSSTLA